MSILSAILIVMVALVSNGCMYPTESQQHVQSRDFPSQRIVGEWSHIRKDQCLEFLANGQFPARGKDHNGEELLSYEWSIAGDILSVVRPAHRGGGFTVERYRILTLTPNYLALQPLGYSAWFEAEGEKEQKFERCN